MEEQIIQKGIELFVKYGFKSVTMDDISGPLGISKKTLYDYFKNKESLVKNCVERRLLEITDKIFKIQQASENPIVELYQIKKEVLKHLGNDSSAPQYQLQKFYPSIYSYLKDKEIQMMGNMFKDSLQRGIEMKLFREHINLDFVTRIYFNGIRGIRNINLFPIELYKIDELMSSFFEYHLRAISTTKGLELLETIKK